MYTCMYISQPFLLHLPPFHPIRLCPTTSPRKLASSCVVQTRVPRILLAGVGRCTRSLSVSLTLSVLCTHFALGLLFSHYSRYDISVPLAEGARGLSFFSPPPLSFPKPSRFSDSRCHVSSLSLETGSSRNRDRKLPRLPSISRSLSLFLSLVKLK